MTAQPRGWTVGDLRQALEGQPDEVPVSVNVTTTDLDSYPHGFLSFGIDSIDAGMTKVGGEPQQHGHFEINLDIADLDGALLYVPWPLSRGS